MNILKSKGMLATHKIQDVTFESDMLSLRVDGTLIKILLDKISPRLKSADEEQRNFYKISPSGYGIHWPLIDEDLSVEALLRQSEI
jgi:hypothetical protein